MENKDILEALKNAYYDLVKEKGVKSILINQVVEKAGIKREDKNTIMKQFDVKDYAELFKTHLSAKVEVDDKNNKKIILKDTELPLESMSNGLQSRIKKLLELLNTGLYEKEEAVRLGLLAAVSGESIFFLGAPGSAKSMIARRIVQAFQADGNKGLKYFEYLMNQFSTPEDIFGNISLRALNGEGESGKEEYKRITDGMLPQADIAFLDEIWKASPAIQNTLLTIINERKFHNGNTVENVPLKALFTASNELPAENAGLEALYDRLILRLCVNYIENEDSFFDMIDAPHTVEMGIKETDKNLLITDEEMKNWKQQIDNVTLSEAVKSVITAIRKELTVQNEQFKSEGKDPKEWFTVSDRRWKKIARILKTSAFLNNRTKVDLMDCQLIEYCIWNTEEQQQKVGEIVAKCIKENGLEYNTAIDDINAQIKSFDDYITKNLYNIEIIYTPETHHMADGSEAYKIESPQSIQSNYQTITPYYLAPDYKHGAYQRTGAYYDQNRNMIGKYNFYFKDNSFKIKNDTVSFVDGGSNKKYNFKIDTRKENKLVKKEDVFKNSNLLQPIQEKTDKDQYNPIRSEIESEIKKIDDFITKQSEPYKANLFARQNCCNVIMNSVKASKKELEDALVELDKVRERYQ